MSKENLQVILDQAIQAARLAAIQIMTIYRDEDFDVQIKSDNSPVTRADILAHHIIHEHLTSFDPSIPILSEESAATSWQERQCWNKYWLIDPLDGTKEFVDRNDEFSINIALIVDGKPIIGVVYAPVGDILYFAIAGNCAFKQMANEQPKEIKVRPLPTIDNQHNPTFVLGRGCFPEALNELILDFPQHEIIRLGSALKTCLIAEGGADLYPRFGKTSEWDTAAAQCVVECAGGAVCDMSLLPLRYNTKEGLLNPDFVAFGDTSVDWRQILT